MPDTITTRPDAVYESSINYNTITTNTTYGKERRRNKWGTPRNRFSLQFNNITYIQATEIRELFNSKMNLITFNWYNYQDEQTYTVRFDEKAFVLTYVGYDSYDVKVNLLEVI